MKKTGFKGYIYDVDDIKDIHKYFRKKITCVNETI